MKREEEENIPEIEEDDIEDIDEEEEDDEEEEQAENPTRRIQINTLNTQIEIMSSDKNDSLEKIKTMIEELICKYDRPDL